MEFSV